VKSENYSNLILKLLRYIDSNIVNLDKKIGDKNVLNTLILD
jgi:hypothetical protein